MARISELHYSNAYARRSGVSEFLEVSLGASDNPADFTVSFYEANGSVGFEVTLDHPDIQVTVDPDNGEVNYVISADDFPILLTDPDGGSSGNYEAYALTETGAVPPQVIDFYDIGGGTQNILALDGAAAGATSDNLPVLVGPNSTTTTLQFNQPNPDTLTHTTVSPGDTGIACFVAGTLIDTDKGPRPVEQLRPGDRVRTMDNGFQPLRWRGSRTVRGHAQFAPVLIRCGTLGAREEVMVSPQHRILVHGWQAELLFGDTEVLVPAKALVDGSNVVSAPCDLVCYVHLLFDAHQIVFTSNLASESFLPGAQTLGGFPHETAEELFALFPGLRGNTAAYGPPARPIPATREARLLRLA